jgi:hypothetical protein
MMTKQPHPRVPKALGAASALALAAVVAACGSSGTPLSTAAKTTAPAGANNASNTSTASAQIKNPASVGANYNPKIVPSQFSSHVNNKYLTLTPGSSHLYKGTRDGVPTQTVVKVLNGTKTIAGVPCVIVSDIVTQNHSLVEKTTDWYAQDKAGNVWYFGENTAEYKNGVVTTTAGTWLTGVDHAKPGIVMPAHPKTGQHFRQEYRPGVALDKATILNTNATIKVPAGTYHHAVITHDINPLDPTKLEHKWYAPGVGFVHAVLHQGGHTEITGLVK